MFVNPGQPYVHTHIHLPALLCLAQYAALCAYTDDVEGVAKLLVVVVEETDEQFSDAVPVAWLPMPR